MPDEASKELNAEERASLRELGKAASYVREMTSTERLRQIDPDGKKPVSTTAVLIVALLAIRPNQSGTELAYQLSVRRESASIALSALYERRLVESELTKGTTGTPNRFRLTPNGWQYARTLATAPVPEQEWMNPKRPDRYSEKSKEDRIRSAKAEKRFSDQQG